MPRPIPTAEPSAALRVEVAPAPGLTLSANYVHTEITDLYPGATVTDYANDVWSAAGRLALMDERLIAAGEIAVSRYVADREVGRQCENGAPPPGSPSRLPP